MIFQALEKSPLIRQSEKHRVDWHRKRLLNLSRMAGESLESYITRASLYRDQLAGLDASLSMGERFFVGHLIDHAKLTRRDKAMLKTHAGEDSELGITGAMMELSAELEGEAGYPIGQAEGQLSGAQGEEFMVQRGVVGFRFQKKEKAALAAEVQDLETATQMSFPMDSVPEEPGGEESVDEGDAAMPADVLHAEHEALALQYKARQKMAEVKKLRNFYRKNEDGKKPKLMKCFVCDEPGHIARDCPKVRGTLNSSNPVLVTASHSQGKNDPEELEWDLLASLCSITEDRPNKAKEVYMVQSGVRVVQGSAEQSHDTGVVAHEAWWNMKELAKRVILDLGCMRNVVGVQWATDVLEHWRSQGRWFKIIPEAEVFRFGDGNTLRSRYRLQLEATFGGRRVLLAFSVVPGPCPPLLSKQSHTKLGVRLDTEHHTLSSRKLKVQNYGLVETEAGHYTMRIDEFHLLSPEDESWQEGNEYTMLSDEEVALFETVQPDAEVFGSCIDPEQELGKTNGLPTHSSSQSDAMSPLRLAATSDTRMSGPVRGELRECGLANNHRVQGEVGGERAEGRGREAEASQGGSSEHGVGEDREAGEGSSLSGKVEVGSDSHRIRAVDRDAYSSGIHGCSSPGSGSGRGGSDYEETGQASSFQDQEGARCSTDGVGGELSIPVELLERGIDLQHSSQHGKSSSHLPMEEVGVAAEGEGSSEAGVEGEGYLAEESQVADLPSQLRDCGIVGSLRCDETEAEVKRLSGSAAEEKLKASRPQRGVTQRLKRGIEENWKIQELMLQLMDAEEHYLLVELFAGCARLSRMAKNREGWVAMDPVDLLYGHNLTDRRTQREVLYLIRQLKPDLVTMSPRCGPWSQFQRINPNIDQVMREREADIPLWRFCREVWDEQDKQGRFVLMENPAQSEAWNLDFMQARPHLYRAKVPQCAFGLRDVINGKPHQKYTNLDVNNEAFRNELLVGAVCNHRPGEHQPIEGHVFWEGRTQRRSALAARWPEAFCEHMLEAAERAWEKCDDDAPRKLTEGREPGGSHYALPVEPLPTVEGELRRQLEKADWRGGQYDYVYFEGTARQSSYKVRQALAHLHVALGHPSQERLTRMLMVSGCGTVVTKAAHGMRCQICEAVRPPGAEPKVSGQRPTRFGEKILSDSFYVWDFKGERFNITHIIDSLTEYHVGMASKNPGAEVTAELLQHRWCAVFGPPELLQTDAGREYEDVIQKISRVLDFRHEVVPPGAKWRQGQVERHGAVVKLMMMRVIHSQQAHGLEDVKMVASACFAAKNRLCNRMGLSPLQAITGRNTAIPASLMDQLCSGHIRQALNEQLEVKEALRRAERIRAAAIDSFNWVDSNEVIRKGLHARSRPPKLEAIQEGCTVYVHDPPPSRRGQARRLQDHSSWDGPALVVCVERHQNVPNRIWVRLRTKVKSYPLEKVRLATPDEMLGSQFVVQVLQDLSEEIKNGKLMVEQDEQVPTPAPPTRKRASRLEGLPEEEGMLEDGPQPVSQAEREMRPQQVRRMEVLNDLPEVIIGGKCQSLRRAIRPAVQCWVEDWMLMRERSFWPKMKRTWEQMMRDHLRFCPEMDIKCRFSRREGSLKTCPGG